MEWVIGIGGCVVAIFVMVFIADVMYAANEARRIKQREKEWDDLNKL